MKQFLVILGITALVWLGVSMSEVREYPMRVHIEMTGYDTMRYALVRADTSLSVQAWMSGFNAMAISMLHVDGSAKVDMSDGELYRAVAFADVSDHIRQQIASKGVRRITSGHDSIRLVLAERGSRAFRVSLDSARFSFCEQYGLYGEPRVTPSTVTLYGADSLLDKVGTVHVVGTDIEGVSHTASYRLQLDPVWERLGDVRTSDTEVEVYLPVETYVEREYTTPIVVRGADTSVRIRIYPEEATVHVWVARRDMERVPEFVVAISYDDVLAGAYRLEPQLVQFPSWMRPRSVEPAEVQCVIIK